MNTEHVLQFALVALVGWTKICVVQDVINIFGRQSLYKAKADGLRANRHGITATKL